METQDNINKFMLFSQINPEINILYINFTPASQPFRYSRAGQIIDQIEDASGNSIGYLWWQQANGYSESQIVKNYISLIQEYDHYKKQLHAIFG